MVRNALRVCATFAVVFAVASVCFGLDDKDFHWTGAGADNHWDNPDNWDIGVPYDDPLFNDVAYVDGAGAVSNPPLIAAGMTAECDLLVSADGPAFMYMSGGTLEIKRWGTWWGDNAGATPTFQMSGGEINYTGGTGVMELGWQEDDSTPQCISTWNMTGGVINAKGISMPGGGGAEGELNLHGGQINVVTPSRGGLVFDPDWPDYALINITRGTLVLNASGQTTDPQDYEDLGWLVAYDGLRDVVIDLNIFDDTYTITSEPTLLGDANFDDTVDLLDLGTVGDHWNATDVGWTGGDFNFDGVVDLLDLGIVGDNWNATLPESTAPGAVPEPATMTLLVGLIGLAWLTRKWATPRK